MTKARSNAVANAAKGDLTVGTGTNLSGILPVSATNGDTLVADSSTATGLKWAAPAAGGKVLQVVSVKYSTATTIASTSFTDTGLSLAITPTLASSKILVLVTQAAILERFSSNLAGAVELRRDSTTVFNLGDTVSFGYVIQATGATIVGSAVPINISYLDNPNTTSSVTYKTRAAISTTSNTAQFRFQEGTMDGTMTLLEIGA